MAALGTPLVTLGGPLTTNTPRAGAQKGRKLPGEGVSVHVTHGSLVFFVQTSPKTAVFQYALHAPWTDRKVPLKVKVMSFHGFKGYEIRPSTVLTPGFYSLRFGGSGYYSISVYEPSAH